MSTHPLSSELHLVARALELVPDPVLVLREGREVHRNPAAARVLEGELLERVHPGDRLAVQRLLREGGADLAGVRLEVAEPHYQRARLTTARLQLEEEVVIQLLVRGEASAAGVHARADPGARFYRTLVEMLPYGVYVIDQAGRFTEVNPALERMLRRPAAELLGRPFVEVLGAESRDAVFALFRDRLASGAGARDYELDLLLPDGEHRLGHVRSSILLEEGVPAGAFGVVRDITAERAAEQALHSSRQQLALALESGGQGLWDWNVVTGETYFDERWQRMLGYEPGELRAGVGSWSELVHPDDLAWVLHEIQRHLDGVTPEYQAQYRMRSRRGDWRWILGRGRVIERGPHGRPLRMIGTHTDLTEQKLAERVVAERESRFRLAARATHDVIWDWDTHTGQIWWSEALTTVFGFPEGSPREYDQEWWLGQVHPDDRGRVQDLAHRALAGELDVWHAEYRMRRADGSYVEVLDRGYLDHDPDGSVARIVGTLTDLSERVRAAARQREQREVMEYILNHLPLLIVICEADGRARWVNREWERVTGQPLDDAVGHDVLFENGILTRVHDSAAGDTGRWEDHPLAPPGRETLRAEWQTVRLPDGSTITIGRDVSQARSVEEQLRQSQKMEAVGRLAGGVAHDFNNMLASIQGFARLLEPAVPTDTEEREYLDQIIAAAQRSARLTRQLLAFSRRQVLRPQLLHLNDTVQDLERMLRRTIGEDVDLVTRLTEGLETVRADPGQLEQVLLNLVLNARDALPRGGRVEIRTQALELARPQRVYSGTVPAGRYVELAVTDTGIGMDEQTLARAFEPFFTTKAQGKGTGLGLSMVYGIVQQSGGHVDVRSRPGAGSTFRVLLRAEAGEAVQPEPRLRAHVGGTETILVVEDESSVRILVERLLQRSGYTVLSAANGRDALRVLGEAGAPVALVLTDVVMPEMNGPDLHRALRERGVHVPVLYMSGYTDEELVRRGALSRESTVLQKPFEPEVLLTAIRAMLDG